MLPSPKTVLPDSYLTLHYRIGLENGSDVISTFGDKPATLWLGQQHFLPALEQALVGMTEGQLKRSTFPAEKAFGERNRALIQRIKLATVYEHTKEENLSAGDWIEFNAPSGGRMVGQLKSLEENAALFDFNHPLAGQAIVFEAHIIAIL